MEQEADHGLRRRRFWTFFPHLRRKIKVGRFLKQDHVEPLFPRYLFVGVRKGMSLFYIDEVSGVSGLVHQQGSPLEIPREVMTELMARCDTGSDEITPERRGADIVFGGKPGDHVRLGASAGALQGLVSEILRVEGSRVIVDWAVGKLDIPADHVAELIKRRGKGVGKPSE